MPQSDFHDYFGPEFKLHIKQSNMENLNSSRYLDKMKSAFFDIIKVRSMLSLVPSHMYIFVLCAARRKPGDTIIQLLHRTFQPQVSRMTHHAVNPLPPKPLLLLQL